MEDKRKVRKQIYLEPHQNKQIKQISAVKDLTESEIIREAISDYLDNNELEDIDPLNKLIGMIKSENKRGSTNHDFDIYLSEESGAHEKR